VDPFHRGVVVTPIEGLECPPQSLDQLFVGEAHGQKYARRYEPAALGGQEVRAVCGAGLDGNALAAQPAVGGEPGRDLDLGQTDEIVGDLRLGAPSHTARGQTLRCRSHGNAGDLAEGARCIRHLRDGRAPIVPQGVPRAPACAQEER
jgi:hypothetical protein